jgi:sugar/nucleoside kinase (ribokinase family)
MTDIVVRMRSPIVVGSDTVSDITIGPGGSASNQAVWLARAGADVHLIACVGDDESGGAAERSLQDSGVQTHFQRSAVRPTGTVVSLVGANGDRSMLADRGANIDLDGSMLAELFLDGAHLHLSGYELLDPASRETGLAALRLASRHKMTTSIDPCSAGPLADVGSAAFLRWTDGVDLFCGNLDEGRVLTGAVDPVDVLEGLASHYPEVALTLGGDGAIYTRSGDEPTGFPAIATTVVDTTGAGDSFTGTFLASWVSGGEPRAAIRRGMEVAAQVVATPGARLPA